ncbi:MAG: S9 family peptidase [Acidimicrobiia bacterium]|nr:S9 family peptidase [Acidimicrobiia bacterium]
MRPDQLGDFAVPSDPRLHPDGDKVAFVVTKMDLEADEYRRRIWLWDGETARPLTSGPADTTPRWSPDGGKLAFLRKQEGDDAKPQLALLDMSGGEAEVVTDFPLGATEIEWSPSGDKIAVVAAEWIPELADVEPDERKRRPRRVTRFPYRFDNLGWVGDFRKHIHVLDVGRGEVSQVTWGDYNESGVAWHPDGKTLAFVSARHERRGLEPGSQVWTVPAAGGDMTARTELGLWSAVSYDRTGQLFAAGITDVWGHPDVAPLYRIEPDGTLVDLTGHLDRNIYPGAPAVSPLGPQWLDDGGAVITVEDSGCVTLARMDANGTTTELLGGERAITGASPNGDGTKIAFVATGPTDPGELYLLERGEERRLTNLNDGFVAATDLVAPQRFTIDHDGVSVEGWVYLPPGDGDVPVLFNIHGGPASAYGYWFFDEFQVYAGAGYGVVATNPRGSHGYGSEHVRAIVHTWHREDSPDMVDLLATVDTAVAEFPRLDGERLGVMGGSYGGYATARVTARDGRFKSAVAERGLFTFTSFAGTSDIGPWFSRMYLGDGLDDPDMTWRSGPLSAADDIATPTLILHSEGDFRCPIEQAEQMFVRLQLNGVESEMVRFPAPEGHELSRSGTPKHRMERFEIILDWHDGYLK